MGSLEVPVAGLAAMVLMPVLSVLRWPDSPVERLMQADTVGGKAAVAAAVVVRWAVIRLAPVELAARGTPGPLTATPTPVAAAGAAPGMAASSKRRALQEQAAVARRAATAP